MGESIYLVTGNDDKYNIALSIFKEYDLELDRINIDTPEIQSLRVEDVSLYSCSYAYDKANSIVITSDVGYYIKSLNGFPGPYLKDVNKMLSSSDILKMMEDIKDREIILKECITVMGPNIETKQFICEDIAKIALESYGEGSTFDKIVILGNDELPMSMKSEEEKRKYFIDKLSIYSDVAEYICGFFD